MMMAGLNGWGDASMGDWDAVAGNDAPVYPAEPYTESSHDPLQWLDGDDGEIARRDPPPRIASLGASSRPRRELAPRAVQEGDGEWVGAQSDPQARAAMPQPDRPAVEPPPSYERRRGYMQPERAAENTGEERRRRRWNPPPTNAAIPPPDTPPPGRMTREAYPMPEDNYDPWLYE
jgi:hypothetical protein